MSSTQQPPRASIRVAMGKNAGRSRDHNRRVVLELLRRNGAMGRKALADLAQISTQAVTNIIDELMAEGLLLDHGRFRLGRGLPPIRYGLNPDGALTIGVEIAVGGLTTAVLDLGGNLRLEEHTPLDDMAPGPVLDRVAASVRRLRAGYKGQLMGVGVVMPGPFGGVTRPDPATLPGWEGVRVDAILGAQSGVPVCVDNDANAAAVGELLFGAGQNVAHFCLLYFGTGIGLGTIMADQPLRGAFGNAGEIGHLALVPGGRPCPCGQSGCLEGYASLHVLRAALADMGLPATLDDLRRLHRAGHPVITRWLEEAAPPLSSMIGMIESIFDPQTVIIGGKLPGALLDDLIARLRLPPGIAARANRTLPRVQRGQPGQISAALGAAALPFFDAITPRLEQADGPQSEQVPP